MNKLYILIRRDLEQGLQLAQTAHAAISFTLGFTLQTSKWNADSNNIAILSVKDEAELEQYIEKAKKENVLMAIFTEPDLGEQKTAAAFLPKDGRIFSSLPRAGKIPKGWELVPMRAA